MGKFYTYFQVEKLMKLPEKLAFPNIYFICVQNFRFYVETSITFKQLSWWLYWVKWKYGFSIGCISTYILFI